MGRVTRKIFEKNSIDLRIVEYTYDESGNVLAITPAGRPAHNFYYDSVDLPYIYDAPEVAQLMPEEVRTQYNYNLDRQLESIVRPDGSSIYLTYELTKEGYSSSTGKLQKITVPGRGDINLTYEATGGKKLSTVTTPEGNILSYTYNGALMASESWSGSVIGTVSRTYNNDFRTTAVSTGGVSAGYTYDFDGLLLTAGDMTITRDPESGMVTGTALDTVITAQTYNQFGEIETYDAGDYSYDIISRDKLGRITEKSETIEGVTTTYQYTYDRAGRLETVWENGLFVSQYTYDSNGNRTSHNATTATYNDQDMMLSYGDNSYTYTANGDLMVKTGVEGTTTYDYDATGNLNSVAMPTKTVSYTYDGMNRRIAKAVDGTVTERFIYLSQLKPFAKVNSDGSIAETYIYGTKVNIPEYVLRNGTKYRIITDHLGSLRLVIDTTDGTVKQRMSFDEFGTVTEDFIEPGFAPLPFGYAGGLYDRDTKLVTFGVREYDSTTGRWMEKEPLGFRGAMNFYSYAGNDPVNFKDVNGLFRFDASVPEDVRAAINNIEWTDVMKNAMKALNKNQITKEQFQEAIKEGSGPIITIDDTLKDSTIAQCSPNPGNVIKLNPIYIDVWFNDPEKSQSIKDLFIASTIGHELTHYFDWFDGGTDFKDDQHDIGHNWEERVYDGILRFKRNGVFDVD